MKKKGLIITISILIILIIASLVAKYIDTANVSTGHEPECCIKIVSYDGSKVTYWGLGYKVVRYVGVSPNEPYKSNIGVKMGSWFMKYEKPVPKTNKVEVNLCLEGKTVFLANYDDILSLEKILRHSKELKSACCDGLITHAIKIGQEIFNVKADCGEFYADKPYKMSQDDIIEFKKIIALVSEKRRIYAYEESVEQMSKPHLVLDKENKEFQFFWSMLSSYIAQGTYEIKDDELICKTDDGNNTYTFEILKDGYKFIEDKSSKIPKYKYSSDAKEAFAPVVDGAIFD